ncbi:tetratricopeptide repeat protein [Paracoccaceae bacterium]|nr:tetratricopeptide repeat protein [Paracoccaceae bacterium]MDC3205667.1 tetratricopeptide repeat protein [Paracoccaceae bacterium]
MELTLEQALQKGIEAHRAGQVQEADRYYTAILKANPKHPDANHNMGVLAVGIGKVTEALPFFKTALEVNPKIDQYWLSYIDALIKLDLIADAKAVLDQAKSNGAKGDGFDQLDERIGSPKSISTNIQEPSQDQQQSVINLYTQGDLEQALDKASQLLQLFPYSVFLYNIKGAANRRLGQLDKALEAYTKALSINPNDANACNNTGNVFKDQGKLEEAIEAYRKALTIKPEYAEAYNNMGIAFQDQGKLDKAIDAYNKALSIKPEYAEAYYNMGVSLQEQGKLDEAVEAYNTALSIKPEYAEAYNNMGIAFQEQGKLDEAVEAYNTALSIKPEYAEAHRNVSTIKKYTVNDAQFLQVQKYYYEDGLRDDTICNLSFALAKMYEDIGKLDEAFTHLSEGNALRKKSLKYSINQDKELFTKLKNTQPHLLENSLERKEISIDPIPIFILGMPRSGTTLVEQIVSSHSNVTGAGELTQLAHYGSQLATGANSIENASISNFRKKYLSELSKLSNGKPFITDKMPQNFLFIPLICAALPEAKLINVQRNAAATCWSNYRQYFDSNHLSYCYDLNDIVEYYNLYTDIMKLWQSHYSDRIYNLNYESLTTDQENQTRNLIDHVGLSWQDAFLSPHTNKRSVRTASQQQVRQKVYKGSSEAWRKYEPYLNGAFDSLPPS